MADQLRVDTAIELIVESSQVQGILVLGHWIVESSLFLKLLVCDDRFTEIFELIDPRLFLEATDTVGEGFLLSPDDLIRKKVWVCVSDGFPDTYPNLLPDEIIWKKVWVCVSDGFPEMVLLYVVSWAFDVGRKIKVVLHESFIQKWLPDFKSM